MVANSYGFSGTAQAYNTVAGGVGKPHGKPTSIPEGGPLSMAIVALLMRAWVLEMKSYAVMARVLADDMQVTAKGPNHLDHFAHAFDKTHLH